MKAVLVLLSVFAFGVLVQAQVLLFAKDNRKVQPMDVPLMTFIAETLHAGKPALNLECTVRMREIKQERKFSDGVKIVEMLEIVYNSGPGGMFKYPEVKAYFPIGSKIIKEETVSGDAGTVEQIELVSEDNNESRFIFQHNGRGEIVWMSFEDVFKTVPCRFKR